MRRNRLLLPTQLGFEPHVDAVLQIEIRIVSQRDLARGEIQATPAVKRLQAEVRPLGHHRLFVDRIPAPSKRVLKKLGHGRKIMPEICGEP
jgi:hypothetical protein